MTNLSIVEQTLRELIIKDNKDYINSHFNHEKEEVIQQCIADFVKELYYDRTKCLAIETLKNIEKLNE